MSRAWVHATIPFGTTNAEAQKFFDQGLSYVYAFNHEEAIRSFKRAAELDPQLAMAQTLKETREAIVYYLD